MNPDNEEQKPVPQTLCGALQKEANCKCLVLSVLIYGCLAAVTWCRCANVTKIVINFSTFPIKNTKHVSPCDDGYIYIPVAFMGMLYLVYLVECYHSPIRIDLLHAEAQSGVVAKLTQLRLTQPTIWWKAISYHYVRRKRQIMRYRNGDNFTTTQVYYERVNSHAATSFYFYDYCGSKDISKELVLDPMFPITKITLSKGFAFSNVRSATEFEEARSRFFAEQEFRDDYMEMREGLDLGCNFSPMSLVAVLGNPWFTRSYVYWCLSALLLSWPLRIIIECNTQYAEYQVTKLFGVNYDTPTNIQIHTSASQLSAPGSYMLAPSYSEALLMEPAATAATVAMAANCGPGDYGQLVPSYSEALLFERAAAELQPSCECPCHSAHQPRSPAAPDASPPAAPTQPVESPSCRSLRGEARVCDSCHEAPAATTTTTTPTTSLCSRAELEAAALRTGQLQRRTIEREYSEPDLRRSAETPGDAGFLRANGRSLENIIESEESESLRSRAEAIAAGAQVELQQPQSRGAIPKRSSSEVSRVTVNPMAERLVGSRTTYFCLKSILKQNRRRFTLVTPEELQSLTLPSSRDAPEQQQQCPCDGCSSEPTRPDSLPIDNRQRPLSCHSLTYRRDNSRTLIFASPIQAVCPEDPFGGRDVVQPSDQPPGYDEAVSLPVLSRLRRSPASTTDSSSSTTTATASKPGRAWRHRRATDPQQTDSAENTHTGLLTSTQSGRGEVAISLPTYDGLTLPPDSRSSQQRPPTNDVLASNASTSSPAADVSSASGATAPTVANTRSRLTRSLTERRSAPTSRRHDQALRKSFTERIDTGCRIPGIKRMNINIETSL